MLLHRAILLRFVEKILVPFRKKVLDELGLPANQKGVLVLDVFAAHREADFLSKLKFENWVTVRVNPLVFFKAKMFGFLSTTPVLGLCAGKLHWGTSALGRLREPDGEERPKGPVH